MDKQMTIWLVIGVYAVFMLAIGILYSRKGSDMAGFTVGGRSAGAWISALSYGTAYFSAVMFIGYSGGSGWSYGLWSVLVGIGNAVFGSLLAWLVLANRTRKITRRHDIKSMPQLFEKRFQSPAIRLFSCIVIFVFLIPYSASVYKGLTSVCSVILGINEQVCMIIIAIASALLLVLGGYMATLKADFVQGFVMMIGVTALIVLVVLSPQVGGLNQGLSNMADYMKAHEMAPLPGKSAVALVSTLLMTSFGTWGLPQMVHKYYGIRDGKEVKRGTIISTFFALLVAGGGYFIGSLSHLFFGETMPEGGKDFIVPLMLDSAGLPNLLIGVILVLLISASVSTLSSITLTACTTVSMDLVKATFAKKMEDRNLAALTRILCLAFVVLSYVIANYPTPILEMMSYSWGIISGSFLAPYLLSLYWKGINRAGAWAGMLGGFLTAFLPAALSGFTTPDGPLYACLAMILSFALCFAGSKIAGVFHWKSAQPNEKFYSPGTEE
ncbi:sodium:solute symporter family protein [Neglecta sp. X4]|uniref:sodium:solute symporter family protein n=1 Tax=unclassified Neglectibacter TaxID=2632164 RepID=UPI00136A6033|nr:MULTISPECIES: sodium:solute symporter family protein [unclassified Neglectibacter]NBI16222.1 sodium:solute symporter family protein [Neglectibacter sp. 59]NBJ71919.1 sodium:solute symporter family protein [Neglectibacter sp. X4]NCE79696.1 sodium:solute symporter family protein [Neglectibacter sp. X58]